MTIRYTCQLGSDHRPGQAGVTNLMRVITKAILKEMAIVARHHALGLVVLVLLQQAVRLADLITKQGVSPLSIAPILALALPALVVTIFPSAPSWLRRLPSVVWPPTVSCWRSGPRAIVFYQLLTPILGLGVFMGSPPRSSCLKSSHMPISWPGNWSSTPCRHHYNCGCGNGCSSPPFRLVVYVDRIDESNGQLEGVLIADSRTLRQPRSCLRGRDSSRFCRNAGGRQNAQWLAIAS